MQDACTSTDACVIKNVFCLPDFAPFYYYAHQTKWHQQILFLGPVCISDVLVQISLTDDKFSQNISVSRSNLLHKSEKTYPNKSEPVRLLGRQEQQQKNFMHEQFSFYSNQILVTAYSSSESIWSLDIKQSKNLYFPIWSCCFTLAWELVQN